MNLSPFHRSQEHQGNHSKKSFWMARVNKQQKKGIKDNVIFKITAHNLKKKK